jgi:hypothetical protein
MTDERIDLSSLDPARDSVRWQHLVEGVAKQAWAARQRKLTIGFQLVAWARPAFAIAAAFALVSGASVWAASRQPSVSQQDSTTTLVKWAMSDQVPPTTEILEVLGAAHGSR